MKTVIRQKRTSVNMEEGENKSADELDLKIEKLNEEISVYRNALSNYLNSHDLLDDLDVSVHQEEVERLIAYENGEAMRLTIQKLDNTMFRVMVYKSATVNHLKIAIRDSIERQLPQGKNKRVSWKYVWKKYCLECEDGTKLLDNRNFLKSFSIHDGSLIKMVVRPIKRREKRPRQNGQGKRFYNPNLNR